jgi:hypothetical protein
VQLRDTFTVRNAHPRDLILWDITSTLKGFSGLKDNREIHYTCSPALLAGAGGVLRLPLAWIICAVVNVVGIKTAFSFLIIDVSKN